MLPIESFGEAERNQRYPSCISMDFDDLKQWRIQHQSENPPGSGSVLPLFVPEPNARISNLSAFSESSSSTTTTTTTTPRLLFSTEAVFSMAQRQELELQALIFKYILAGAAVPVELLQPIKALLNSPSAQSYLYHPYQPYQHFQPHVLQSGYWGRNAVDPEPGRCRRTDGKKWRCSRDVVPGQKYCERHVHRGRNRSRKPVEIPTPAGTAAGGLKTPDSDSVASLPLRSMINRGSFVHSKQSPLIDLTPLNHRSSETKIGNEFPLHTQNIDVGRSEGQLLRHFFDERPKPREESNAAICHHANPTSSTATGLSISIPRNYSSDFSLKLSTGNIDGPISREGSARVEEQSHRVWGREWAIQQGSSMGGGGGGGGLLAEMLRTSTSNSPTSVLHELRRGCVSETSSLST